MEIFNPNSNIHFLGLRKYTISIAILLVVGSLALIFTRGLNYGLDFTGGVVVEVSYQQSMDIADVRASLNKGGFDHSGVQPMDGTRDVSIRLQPKDDPAALKECGKVNVDKIADDVLKALTANGAKVKIKQ